MLEPVEGFDRTNIGLGFTEWVFEIYILSLSHLAVTLFRGTLYSSYIKKDYKKINIKLMKAIYDMNYVKCPGHTGSQKDPVN